jgi:toxin ParE1/3/4
MANLIIRFSNSARQELNEIMAFIALYNTQAAGRLSLRAEKALSRLVEFPNSGKPIPEDPSSRARELVIPPLLRVFYRVEGSTIRILHVIRAEQLLPPYGW